MTPLADLAVSVGRIASRLVAGRNNPLLDVQIVQIVFYEFQELL
jgi:hypothetical protein